MEHRRIIKHGSVVLATHEDGSIGPDGPVGLFLADTRFLSTFRVYLNDCTPKLLGSTEEKVYQSGFLSTNADVPNLQDRSIGILQRNSLEGGTPAIVLVLTNWTSKAEHVKLSVEVEADFFDSFEARG